MSNEGNGVSLCADDVRHPSLLGYPMCWLFCWCVLPLAYMFIDWLGSTLTIAPDRVAMRKGLIGRNIVDVTYDRIQNVRVDQSALGRILGYGTLMIATAGTYGYEIVFSRLGRPFEVMNDIKRRQSQIIQNCRMATILPEAATVPQTSSPEAEVPQPRVQTQNNTASVPPALVQQVPPANSTDQLQNQYRQSPKRNNTVMAVAIAVSVIMIAFSAWTISRIIWGNHENSTSIEDAAPAENTADETTPASTADTTSQESNTVPISQQQAPYFYYMEVHVAGQPENVVNIRAGGSYKAEILGQFQQGSIVVVECPDSVDYGTKETSRWLKVVGYLNQKADIVKCSGWMIDDNLNPLPLLVKTNNDQTWIYAKADRNSEKVAKTDKDDYCISIESNKVSDTVFWNRVMAVTGIQKGAVGWVYNDGVFASGYLHDSRGTY